MNDKYADSIIKDPSEYDAIVVSGVRDISEADEEGTECVLENAEPEFFSAYAKLKGTPEVECIGDFSQHEDALCYARQIAEKHGWAVVDDFLSSNSE